MFNFFKKPNYFDLLPLDVKHYLFNMLDIKTLTKLPFVCKNWRDVCNSESFWKNVGFKSKTEFIDYFYSLGPALTIHKNSKRDIAQHAKTDLRLYLFSNISNKDRDKIMLPVGRYFFSDYVIVYPEAIHIKNYFLIIHHGYPYKDNTGFKKFIEQNRATSKLAMVLVSNQEEITHYQALAKNTDTSTLLLFVTSDVALTKNRVNSILWKPGDDQHHFYTRVIEKIEEISNILQPQPKQSYQCRVM
jgi:hypothetical protein